MRKYLLYILFIIPLCFDPICHAQTSVKVSDPRLEMVDNRINISYNILNSNPDEMYTISIVIKDEDGNTINARTLDGDIGEEVTGGSNKNITWNLEADNVFIDAFVFVQINVKVIPPPAPVIIEPEEEPVLEEPKEEDAVSQDESKKPEPDEAIKKEEPPTETKSTSYNRTGIVLQSLALPGLGLSRVTGKPHWLRGVAGYGCIVGSIVLNRQAVNTFNEINDLVYFDEINEAYDKSLQQDNISEILAYAAIGIWVTDFIWTLVGTSDLNKPFYYSESRGFSFGSNLDPLTNVPLVSVRYRF